ncbi:hypothetical protein [Candidatus Endomicrobiellum agilis]|uniref:hypothetical protein n=1 Tax=Candidatus Endomicrobiellum agilis TaxID=3238957 RepID=UPI00358AA946|nr:hypothetical protein [Endomicrobium sp.]
MLVSYIAAEFQVAAEGRDNLLPSRWQGAQNGKSICSRVVLRVDGWLPAADGQCGENRKAQETVIVE